MDAGSISIKRLSSTEKDSVKTVEFQLTTDEVDVSFKIRKTLKQGKQVAQKKLKSTFIKICTKACTRLL